MEQSWLWSQAFGAAVAQEVELRLHSGIPQCPIMQLKDIYLVI